MSLTLRTLFLPLALLVRADYVLTSLFASPVCAGSSVNISVDAGPCIQADDNVWRALVCTSSSSLNYSYFSDAQCSGTPLASIPSFAYSCTFKSDLAGYLKSVCTPGKFDPVPPQPYISQDLYIVDRGAAGGATCPPTLGSGVQLYVRQYFSSIAEKITLNECVLSNDRKSSVYISCDPRDPRTLLIEGFDSQDCTGVATYVYDGCQNSSNVKAMTSFASALPGSNVAVGAPVLFDQIIFSDAGTLCLPPGPAPPAAAASLSTASVVGIGAAVGLATAALALATNYAYQRFLFQRRKPADAAPLLLAGVSMVAR